MTPPPHPDTHHGPPAAPHDAAVHAEPGGEAHPTWSTYWKVATILTLITVGEVRIYYIPSFVSTAYFVPTLLILSAVKFFIVVMFYMHLKYDARIFRALFGGPLLIAMLTISALLLLFGKIGMGLVVSQ
jgi:cytochrome c oxidase subunit IV